MIEENKSSMKNSVRRIIIAGIGVLIQIIWVVVLLMRLNEYSHLPLHQTARFHGCRRARGGLCP